jgi:predicted SnoaL-like aldol condensation-catalyzing enzyme
MPDLEASKRTVLAFYEQAVNRRDFTAAAQYLGPVYIQHRNDTADGAAGMEAFIERMHAAYPGSHGEIKTSFRRRRLRDPARSRHT